MIDLMPAPARRYASATLALVGLAGTPPLAAQTFQGRVLGSGDESVVAAVIRLEDDTGAQVGAAARAFRHDVMFFGRDDAALDETAVLEQVAVKLDDILAAGALVQAVHVLGDERQARHQGGQPGQGNMARIGFGTGDELAAPAVPAPDQLGVP